MNEITLTQPLIISSTMTLNTGITLKKVSDNKILGTKQREDGSCMKAEYNGLEFCDLLWNKALEQEQIKNKN